ncbi:MAG: NAD(P)/FAD-dependent oxidoreductase [Steroidobacteraceae bacterium]
MQSIEVAVIGAGVIGLAIARALAQRGHEVLVLEAERTFGTGASSRNSEVIHAGLYDAPGSLKARLCVEGRTRLYDFCSRHGIAHRRCGKLVVATSAVELTALATIASAATANGAPVRELGRAQALALEPQLRCTAALLSPESGILDTHALLLALLGQAEARGALCAYASRVTHLALEHGATAIAVNGGQPCLRASLVINAAGLDAPCVARATEGFPREHIPRTQVAKGSYFALPGRAPFERLVYPVPEPGGLGVHLTLDLQGHARFGPDVEWLDAPAVGAADAPRFGADGQGFERLFEVDARRGERFYEAIRRYWPALPEGALRPAYAGLRPKLSGPGEPAADFRIDGPEIHGTPMIHLFGIESPGLTAALAIAERVAQIARVSR